MLCSPHALAARGDRERAMYRGDCHICLKPLLWGTVVMDRDGLCYHLPCWCHFMDIRTAEVREAVSKRQELIAGRKTRIAVRNKQVVARQKPGAEKLPLPGKSPRRHPVKPIGR